jgi:hypothetical protein
MKGIKLVGTVQGNGGNLVSFREQQLIGHNALTPSEKSALDIIGFKRSSADSAHQKSAADDGN